MSKQLTAIDWLYQELWKQTDISLPSTIYEKAKEIEKQNIIDAFWHGDNTDCTSEQNSKEFAEQYYNETYG